MCIYIKDTQKPVRVSTPRKAYKVFEVNGKELISPFRNHKTKLDVLNNTCHSTEDFLINLDPIRRTKLVHNQNTYGFHLYPNKTDAIALASWNKTKCLTDAVVTECIIPKGAAFIRGTDDDDRATIMANQYKVTEIIHREE